MEKSLLDGVSDMCAWCEYIVLWKSTPNKPALKKRCEVKVKEKWTIMLEDGTNWESSTETYTLPYVNMCVC